MVERGGSTNGRVPRAFQTHGEPPQLSPIQPSDAITKESERSGDSSRGAQSKNNILEEQLAAQKEGEEELRIAKERLASHTIDIPDGEDDIEFQSDSRFGQRCFQLMWGGDKSKGATTGLILSPG